MADEDKNESGEQAPEEQPAPEEQAPGVADDAAPEPEPEPEPEAAAEPEPAPEPEAAPEPEPEAEPAADAAASAADVEPAEALGPKQLRRRRRSTHSGEARPTRTPQERADERASRRAARASSRRAYRAGTKAKRGESRGEGTAPAAREPGKLKVRQGVVVSDRADKTITVRIDVARRHRTYKKIVRESSTLHAHDERNEASAGDTVRVVESRPLSRTKRWRLVEVVERAR